MKPGIPWSVKGIEPEAREAAKLAARRAGLTLGEWLNSVIFDQSGHDLGGQAGSQPWDAPVPAPQLPPELLRPEAGPRPSARADRHEDSALRLQDIARQLADLAQRERHSAPPPTPERPRDEREEVARIIGRIEENERQTVEALGAVNERLGLLARQIAQLGRAPGLQRPEDVPGYPALEGALRSVVEHIEVSDKHTRDSLRAMQDRIAEVAERRAAPADSEMQLAAPLLSNLEGRLADMVNRIQRSEGLMTERIESARASAQQMANQAQASAVTALRGEMREVETRVLSSLKEAQAAAATAPAAVATEIARLHGDMAALSRRLDEVKATSAAERDVQSLRTAIEQLSARVAQGPDLRVLADMDKRLGDINRRLELAAAASRAEPQSLRQIEEAIATVTARVERTEQQLAHLATMEQSIRRLQDSLAQLRDTKNDAPPASTIGPSPELRALEEGLRAIRESSAAAERRHQDTFAAVHETLAEIVRKIAALEAKPEIAAPQPAPAVLRTRIEVTEADRAPATDAEAASAPAPLSGGDDFIAAARRAAQAAATRPATLHAEQDMPSQAAERRPARLTLLQRLRGARSQDAASPAPGTKAGSGRRALILAGLALLVAASAFAYRNLSAPVAPGVQQASRIAEPKASPRTSLAVTPRDPLVTGSLAPRPKDKTAMLLVPPPGTGSEALRHAAAEGDPRAQFLVAGRYLDGHGVAQDFAQAFSWYQRAAARGLAPAQYRLGTLYELGKGTATDPRQALAWYERAALGGNVRAMHNAAVLLAGNKAGPADFDRAFRWFKAAAERGFADSQFNLAILCERGLGTPPSAEEAYVWYALAARQGDTDSRQRADLLARMLPAASRKAADLRIARWTPTPADDSANAVTVTDPAWTDARADAYRQSS